MINLLASLLALLGLAYWYLSRKYSYWSSRGIQGPKPVPILGNLLDKTTRNSFELEQEWLAKYGKVYGVYNGMQPDLSVSDPELIKQVMVRDFNCWVNRQPVNTYHEINNSVLFGLENENWRRVRAIVTPTFTTGKLRRMSPLMNVCIDNFVGHLNELTKDGPVALHNTRKLFMGFAIDVIASTGFATETDSQKDPNNPFLVNGMKFFNINPFKLIALFGFNTWTNTLLGVRMFTEEKVFNFFTDVAKKMLEKRKQEKAANPNAAKRNDLLQLLIDAEIAENELDKGDFESLSASMDYEKEESKNTETTIKSHKKLSLNENELIAQCMVLFVAGFETTSNTLSNIAFELAHDQGIQKRLHDDIVKLLKDVQNEQYYDKVMSGMPYLDAVVKEALRKYPAAVRIVRRLAKDGYVLNGIEMFANQLVEIPTLALHYNEEYYPDPERFNPERFMPENADNLVPYTYLPFGTGPRNCVGMRFAHQEIKLALVQLIKNFKFTLHESTPKKLSFNTGGFLLQPHPHSLMVERW